MLAARVTRLPAITDVASFCLNQVSQWASLPFTYTYFLSVCLSPPAGILVAVAGARAVRAALQRHVHCAALPVVPQDVPRRRARPERARCAASVVDSGLYCCFWNC